MANLASIMNACDSIFESSVGDRREDRGSCGLYDPFSDDRYDDLDETEEGGMGMKSRPILLVMEQK